MLGNFCPQRRQLGICCLHCGKSQLKVSASRLRAPMFHPHKRISTPLCPCQHKRLTRVLRAIGVSVYAPPAADALLASGRCGFCFRPYCALNNQVTIERVCGLHLLFAVVSVEHSYSLCLSIHPDTPAKLPMSRSPALAALRTVLKLTPARLATARKPNADSLAFPSLLDGSSFTSLTVLRISRPVCAAFVRLSICLSN